MVNGKKPLLLTLLGAALAVAALLTLQPYSADFPGSAYAKPARRYVRAALRQDSMDLVRMSASAGAVAWALDASRNHPDSLASWAGHTQAWTGARHGDTADVFLYPAGDTCGQAPIVFRFVGSGKDARVLTAHSACLNIR